MPETEKRRFPQLDRTAVLIAEDITSRFSNLIALVNGHVPIIGIQMSAVRVGDKISLVCTRVIDKQELGYNEEEEEQEFIDRNYSEVRCGSRETVAMANELLNILDEAGLDTLEYQSRGRPHTACFSAMYFMTI